jgi:integrase
VRFLLLTGARRTEAAAMPWAEIDGADWLLPGARNKTKLDLLRPLSEATLDVMGDPPKGATFVFSTDGGATPLSGFSKFKAEFDRATGSMPRWTLHDLRRTARSLMSRTGSIPSDHAERVLGHVIGGIRAVYDRHEYRDEKRDALEKLARLVDFIVHGRTIMLRRVERGADANA